MKVIGLILNNNDLKFDNDKHHQIDIYIGSILSIYAIIIQSS
jgi:hypothetical protein